MHRPAPRRRRGDIGIVAGELDADRVVLRPGDRSAVVDVLVVVTVGAVAMGRHEVLRHRPIDRAVGLDPDMTPRGGGFFACSAAPPRAEPAGPSVWCTMMLLPGMGVGEMAPGREPDHLQAGNVRRAGDARDLREFGVRCGGWGEQKKGGQKSREQAEYRRPSPKAEPNPSRL